jgi:hypothetical protein
LICGGYRRIFGQDCPGFVFDSVKKVSGPEKHESPTMQVRLREEGTSESDKAACNRATCSLQSTGLSAKVELLDDLVVLIESVILKVIQELAAAVGHHDETSARVKILAVGAQVIGKVVNTSRENRDLDFGGTGVLVIDLKLLDYFGFVDGHCLVVLCMIFEFLVWESRFQRVTGIAVLT